MPQRDPVRNPKLHNPIEKHFLKVTRYHYYAWALLFIFKWPTSWHLLSLIFMSPKMSFDCKGTENSTNSCPCEEPVWDRSIFTETFQTKYSLYCSNQWIISFSESIYYTGILIGSFLFGFLSDRYGRLKMYCASSAVLSIAGTLVVFMPTFVFFIIARAFEGFGVGGAIVTSFVLCIEYCGLTHRETITALYHVPINLAHVSIAGISYFLRHIDSYQLALSIPIFFSLLSYWLILESPKWLMDNDKIDKAAEVMEKICHFNGTNCENIKEELTAYHTSHTTKSGDKIYIWHLFRHRKLSLNLACMSYIYFVCGMGYYGVSQFIGKMSGDIHYNVALSGILLLPGTIASVFLLRVLGRRTFLMSTSLLSGIFMIIVICIPENSWCKVFIASLCDTFFFMSFIIVFLYGVELFPTGIRNSVLGFLSVLSRLGQIVSPPLNDLPQYVSGSIFGVLAIIAGLLCLLLPETKDTELPSTIEETKTFTKKRRHLEENET